MRVLLAGGGTAGHINPAIAIAGYIREKHPDAEILFAGTPKGMEAQLVPKAGYDFAPIQVSGFVRKVSIKGIVHNAQAVAHIVTASGAARRMIRRFRPDIVIGTGGYVSGPVVLAAAKMGIRTLIHEQNAFPGVTNKLLAKKVDRVLLAVADARRHFPEGTNCEVVGNPIRESVMMQSKREARKKLGIADGKICVLSFGGSLGARVINQAGADLIQWNHDKDKIHHIHGYGRLGKAHFPDMLRERGLSLELLEAGGEPNICVREYIDNMDECLAAADLVISRSGAMTLSELEACGKASILIPSPYVAENHQYHNARVLAEHDAAILIKESEYSRDSFLSQFTALYNDREKLKEFGRNASKLAILDTSDRIYKVIRQLL